MTKEEWKNTYELLHKAREYLDDLKRKEVKSMKVQIIGGSGTGKSTLAKFISEKENIMWIDTDRYLWKDESFTEKSSD